MQSKGCQEKQLYTELTLKDCDTRGSNRGLWVLMCIIRYLGTPNPPKQSRLQILVCGRKEPPHLGFTSSTVYYSPCIPAKTKNMEEKKKEIETTSATQCEVKSCQNKWTDYFSRWNWSEKSKMSIPRKPTVFFHRGPSIYQASCSVESHNLMNKAMRIHIRTKWTVTRHHQHIASSCYHSLHYM